MFVENCVWTILWNTWKIWNASFLCFIKYNQVIRVQSSMNMTNHFTPDPSEWGAGSHTSEWINEKGVVFFLIKLKGNEARWLLAWIHISHSNTPSLTYENKLKNKYFKYKKDGWPKRQCHIQIWCSLSVVCFIELASPKLQSSIQ